MVQLIFEITWFCPAKCAFCLVPKMEITLPLSDYRRILEIFRQHYEDSGYAVVLSGGEPSTVPTLKEYVDAARELGYEVTIVTNAFNIRNVLDSRPDVVELSLDYYGSRHDESRGVKGLFDKAMKLVSLAVQNGISVVVRSTLMNDNIQDILKIRGHLDRCGFKEVPVLGMPVRGAPKLKPSRQQIEELLNIDGIYLSDSCPAGISSFVITPKREVLACIFYRKRLGQFQEFTKDEFDEIIENGAKIPRFPCE